VECLESICALDYPLDQLEVIVVDNGGAENTSAVAVAFADRLRLRYLLNPGNQGYGFSVNRGIFESTGLRIVLLNDDARPQRDFLARCDRLLEQDPEIGCVGCRVIESGYIRSGAGIGRVDPTGEIVANFDVDCGEPIEVEHVYGFCYVFTREAVERAGLNDRTLLARRYSSGNRIETDHCLAIRKSGLKVVFNPRMVATHLAKPRADMSEVSMRWKLNSIRNTLYLYLKHYGLFGKRGAALRLTFLVDVGLLSAIRRPSRANLVYLLNGIRARISAYGHYLLYLIRPTVDSPDAFRRVLDSLVSRTEAGDQAVWRPGPLRNR
jgi:GT2 family glycosyltransferase